MQIHSKASLQEHLKNKVIRFEDAKIFSKSKVARHKLKVTHYHIPENSGITTTKTNPLFVIDNDHVQDYPKAYTKLLELIYTTFGEDVGLVKQNFNPKKFKLVFSIIDYKENKQLLNKYDVGFDVISENHSSETDLEFFGVMRKEQKCKTGGDYSKEITLEEYEKIQDNKIKFTETHYTDETETELKTTYFKIIGSYNNEFSVIELTAKELCDFLDKLLETELFKVHESNKKSTSNNAAAKDPRTYLNAIRYAEKSNEEYLQNCFPYIKSCIKHRWALNDCLDLMRDALQDRNIFDSKFADFEKNATEIYNKSSYFDEHHHFKAYEMAEELIQEHSIVKYNNNPYYYVNNHYCGDLKQLPGYMLAKCKELTKKHRNEVISYIEDTHNIKRIQDADPYKILFNNGVLDLITGQLVANSTEYFIQNIIPHNFNANAYDEELDNALNDWSCNDLEIRALLEECIGYCLFRKNFLQKCFILSGDQNNGKSTFIYLLQKTIGIENICSLDLNDLGGNYNTAQLYNKLANIGDDIKGDYLPDTAIFKKLVTGDIVNARNIREAPFDFEPYAKLIFSCNEIPKMKDVTGAIKRRLIIIPFNADFSNSNKKGLKYKLSNENAFEYLLKIGVDALTRLIKNKEFTQCKLVDDALNEYSRECDIVQLWLEDYYLDTGKDLEPYEKHPTLKQLQDLLIRYGTETTLNALYKKFVDWCTNNAYLKLNNVHFTRRILKLFPNLEVVTFQESNKRQKRFQIKK